MSITCLFFGIIEHQIDCFAVHRVLGQLVEKKATEYAKIFFLDLVEKSVDSRTLGSYYRNTRTVF